MKAIPSLFDFFINIISVVDQTASVMFVHAALPPKEVETATAETANVVPLHLVKKICKTVIHNLSFPSLTMFVNL